MDVLADYNTLLEVGQVPLTLKALKQLIDIVEDCKKEVRQVLDTNKSVTDKKEILNLIYNRLKHISTYEEFNWVDEDMLDVVYLDKDVEVGDIDEVIITISSFNLFKNNGGTGISYDIEFGIYGEDYPISYTLTDIKSTYDYYNKRQQRQKECDII